MRPFHRLRRLAAIAGLLSVGLLAATAAPAQADTPDGLWYFDALNVQAAHDAGWTGEGVTVAVLDSPINPDIPTLRDADVRVHPEAWCYVDGRPSPPVHTGVGAQHGTNVASFIVGSGTGGGVKGVAPDATLLYYAVLSPEWDNANEVESDFCLDADGEETRQPIADAINHAVDSGVDVISLSVIWGFTEETYFAVARALGEGVIFVSGLPNRDDGESDWAGTGFMLSANGVVNVQMLDSNGDVPPYPNMFTGELMPNVDPNADVAAPGVGLLYQGGPDGDWSTQQLGKGTSFATPIVAGFLAVMTQRYPEATSNQIIQSLLHNTGGGDGEMNYNTESGTGFGFASLTRMLSVDPTQYPDVNPLLTEDGNPSLEDIELAVANNGLTPTWEWEPAEPENPTTIWDVLVPFVIVPGAVLLLLAIAAVVVVLLVRRRGRTARGY